MNDAISKQAVLEWANDQPSTNAPYYHGIKACKEEFLVDLDEGRFDLSTPSGEVDKQQKAWDKAKNALEYDMDDRYRRGFIAALKYFGDPFENQSVISDTLSQSLEPSGETEEYNPFYMDGNGNLCRR